MLCIKKCPTLECAQELLRNCFVYSSAGTLALNFCEQSDFHTAPAHGLQHQQTLSQSAACHWPVSAGLGTFLSRACKVTRCCLALQPCMDWPARGLSCPWILHFWRLCWKWVSLLPEIFPASRTGTMSPWVSA